MTTDHVNGANADEEVEFAVSTAAMLRTAARAADGFGVSCRELARRFAEQVDAGHVPDADPSGLPIGLAFREVYQQGPPSWPGSMNAGMPQIRPSTGKP